jgi:hypothetical protein
METVTGMMFLERKFEDGPRGIYHVEIYDISWDIDEEIYPVLDLPRGAVYVTVDVDRREGEAVVIDRVEEAISDWLSDHFGWCHKGFAFGFPERLTSPIEIMEMQVEKSHRITHA